MAAILWTSTTSLYVDNEAVSILHKVLATLKGATFESLASRVAPIQPFSIRTNFRRQATVSDGMTDPVVLLSKATAHCGFIERNAITKKRRLDRSVEGARRRSGSGRRATRHGSDRYYGPPFDRCSRRYGMYSRPISLPVAFKRKPRQRVRRSYLRTRFVRFLVSLRKITQHALQRAFTLASRYRHGIATWTDAGALQEVRHSRKDEIAFIEIA